LIRLRSNTLLNAFPQEYRTHLISRCEPVQLAARSTQYLPNQAPLFAHFITSGLVSTLVSIEGEGCADVGMIGSEGLVEALHLIAPANIPMCGTTLLAIYFQNGGEWVGSRQSTMEIAHQLTGGLDVSFSDLFSEKQGTKDVRVDFDEIPLKVPQVMQSAVRNILPLLKGFADKLPRPVVRESLLGMGLSAIIVDAALHAYYAGALLTL